MSERGKRILLVADEMDLVTVVRFWLEPLGVKILVAGDGKNGIEMAQREIPDLILLDLMLPGVNGLEVCRYLKFSNISSHIPIVVISVRSHENDRRMMMDAGADVYLVKPFPGEILQGLVKQYGLVQ